ncbi:MAG: fibrobacter succinogenes major paralogous domain-containing protein, partial [Dysgonamonadaceae bacterium]|nr:fibrobacter succinogenes major paralogous domain-containing protein [Dysgonamonadaceae bacterium]
VNDGLENYVLQRTITVGDRDECSPVAGLFDAEGNRYTVSRFGGVCWMTQNLRSTWTKQGNQVQTITADVNKDNDPNAVVYYYPNGNTNSPSGYGFLYSWGAANIGTLSSEATDAFRDTTSNRQGICPDGWTLPSDYDWNQLEKEIAINPGKYSLESDTLNPAWNVAYEGGTDWRPEGNPTNGWGRRMKSPTAISGATNGVSKTDGTGFNALLVGYFSSGKGAYFGTYTFIWSSSASSATAAWRRFLANGDSGANRGTYAKYYMFSVRCKK